MELFAASMAEHRQELVRLDTAIGDGDHGTNMDRGMQKAIEKLHADPQADAGAVLKTVAMTLISTVGGAAGPLYGTLFLQLGGALAGQAEVDLPAYAAAWRKAVDGVQARGKAQLGDKTMVDALLPAVAALEQAAAPEQGPQAPGQGLQAPEQGPQAPEQGPQAPEQGPQAPEQGPQALDQGLQAATDAAREGMIATTPLVARKGRASYLGERSAGHQDPGATSTYYLFESAMQALRS
ncbi:MAG: dihydroxyacetone kinase subunit L [Acidobacteriota bacterium]|nr:dihydroxyacetone kinase subunit L [Acidobacteriota bacterium]